MSKNNTDNLKDFVENVCERSHLRVESDLGDGFFKLRPSEAQRRQAAQDIRCSEDAVVEMLRNSRDAGASDIFLATNRDENIRNICVIDNGSGIPETHHETIFEPYVTSKLDTMTKDMWGVHGRGMALYSIKENSINAHVARSHANSGAAIRVKADTTELPEKVDQSTFPSFFIDEKGALSVRGPKNIQRIVCEFAVENRDKVNVYCGSPSEIAATLYKFCSQDEAQDYMFGSPDQSTVVTSLLGYAADPLDFAEYYSELGIDISPRTARRIMDGEITPLPSVLEEIARRGFSKKESVNNNSNSSSKDNSTNKDVADGPFGDIFNKNRGSQKALKKNINEPKVTRVKLNPQDTEHILEAVKQSFAEISPKYYLKDDINPQITIKNGKIYISFDISPV